MKLGQAGLDFAQGRRVLFAGYWEVFQAIHAFLTATWLNCFQITLNSNPSSQQSVVTSTGDWQESGQELTYERVDGGPCVGLLKRF